MSTVTGAVRKVTLTTWEGIWYVVQNIAFGAAYFGKIPVKRAMQDFGLIEMTSAEHFWYVVQNIFFRRWVLRQDSDGQGIIRTSAVPLVPPVRPWHLAVGTARDSGPLPPPVAVPPSATAPPVAQPAEVEAAGPDEEPTTS